MKRHKHSLSHYRLLSCDMGELVPIGLMEVLPGDTFQQATSLLLRVSPLLAPVMHPVHVRVHHWFVPHRLVWEDFEDFITGGPDGMDATVFPTITMPASTGADVGSLADYLTVPTEVADLEVSALPFRCYNLIFNEWYRDQDLVTAKTISMASGADTTTETELLNVAWEKDYFTSSRPWTQKGPEVSLPLGESAPVTTTAINNEEVTVKAPNIGAQNYGLKATGTGSHLEQSNRADMGPLLEVDLADATAASVNDLRLALALQRYEEARARYGSRYTEYLRFLGVRSSDARLQRPEYLGGGKQTIQFSEVLQTAEGSNAVATMRGHGITGVRSRRYRRYFEEHGYVLSLLSVKPKTMYTQGLSRTWNRRTKEDFWQKELQHIGQQEVLNKEIYAPHTSPDDTFGYQDRYDEYRRCESGVSGEFRTTVLDYWHMARIFASEPALNASFVEADPTKRVHAVQTNDVLWIMANHSVQARRPVAARGTSYIF